MASHGRPALATQSELRHAYYSVLKDDPQFIADLRSLQERVLPPVRIEPPKAPSPSATRKYIKELRILDQAKSSPEQDAAVRHFAAKWHLPQGYEFEVWTSLYLAREGFPLRLYGSREPVLAPIDPPALLKPSVNRTGRPPRISDPFAAFAFLPGTDYETRIQRLVEEFRNRLRLEVKARQQQANRLGWRPLGPRHRDRQDRLRLARRLYRRVVLGWSWSQIANNESKEAGVYISPDAVRVSVGQWAIALSVTLPKSSAKRQPTLRPE